MEDELPLATPHFTCSALFFPTMIGRRLCPAREKAPFVRPECWGSRVEPRIGGFGGGLKGIHFPGGFIPPASLALPPAGRSCRPGHNPCFIAH